MTSNKHDEVFIHSTQLSDTNITDPETTWNKLYEELCKKYKEILNLPEHARVNYLYGHQQDGLFGISIAGEDSEISF